MKPLTSGHPSTKNKGFLEHCLAPASAWPSLVLAALTGFLFAFCIFGPAYILGTAPCWQFPEADTLQHVIGWQYFIKDDWRFPLFYVPTLYYPEGINIILTDSMALTSLLSKILYKIFHVEMNPFSSWELICFVMQPVAAVLLMQALGVQKRFELFLISILSLSLFTFISRAVNTTVLAQFTIILSLYFYVKVSTRPFKLSLWIAAIILLLLTLLVHLYLWAMIVPIFIAGIAQTVCQRHLRGTTGFLIFTGTAALSILWMYLIGLIDPHMPLKPIDGFGGFSMNVLSPLIPPPGTLFAGFFHALTLDATGGQVEGFNYLGAGTLLLLGTLLLTRFGKLQKAFRKHWALTLLMTGFFLYALSNRIYIGHHLLFTYNVPSGFPTRLTSSFRVSGRFFWPVVYALALFGSAATVLWLPRKSALPLLIAATLLNVVELKDYRQNLMHLQDASVPRPLHNDAWETMIRQHQKVFQFPSFDCGGLSGQKPFPDNYADYQISLASAHVGVPINSTSSARPFKNCARERTDASHFDDRTLYVFSTTEGNAAALAERGFDHSLCRDFAEGVVCSKAFATNTSLGAGAGLQLFGTSKTAEKTSEVPSRDRLVTLVNAAFANPDAGKHRVTIDLEAPLFLSQIGVMTDKAWHTVADNHSDGFLIYGPYLTLPSGRYVVQLMYHLDLHGKPVIWDIVSNAGKDKHASMELPPSVRHTDASGDTTAQLEFTLKDPASFFEIRTFSDGMNELKVARVHLSKLPPP